MKTVFATSVRVSHILDWSASAGDTCLRWFGCTETWYSFHLLCKLQKFEMNLYLFSMTYRHFQRKKNKKQQIGKLLN